MSLYQETSNTDDINLYEPNQFKLYQNYPNPFNGSTIISWNQKLTGNTLIKIYDVIGNEIAVLVNNNFSAGYHSVNFETSQLSSGIYIYKLQTGNFISNNKMVLLK